MQQPATEPQPPENEPQKTNEVSRATSHHGRTRPRKQEVTGRLQERQQVPGAWLYKVAVPAWQNTPNAMNCI